MSGRQAASRLPMTETQLTHNLEGEPVRAAALSSDSHYFAYADFKGIHVRSMESGEERDLSLPAGFAATVTGLRWFANGEKLLVQTASADLWVIPLIGGAPAKIRSQSRNGRPSPDGSSIAFVEKQTISIMGVNGDSVRQITSIKSGHISDLEWSPTGRRLAYAVFDPTQEIGMSVTSVASDGSNPLLALTDSLMNNQLPTLTWTVDGRLIFSRWDSKSQNTFNLWQISLNPDTGASSGHPEPLTHSDGWYPQLASHDGKQLLAINWKSQRETYVAEIKDNGARFDQIRKVTFNAASNFPFGWYPDNKSFLVSSDRTGGYRLYRQPLTGEMSQPLISGADDQTGAVITPDGAWILYETSPHESTTTTRPKLMRAPATGGFGELVLELGPGETAASVLCNKATKACVIGRIEKDDLVFYQLDPLKGQGPELGRITTGAPGAWMTFDLSPDGTQIVVTGSVDLDDRVRIYNLKNHTQQDLALPAKVTLLSICWSADGRALYGAGQRGLEEYFIVHLDLSGNLKVMATKPVSYFIDVSPSPDGRYAAYMEQNSEANAFLLENF
jgi:Tol biopolymer transport system component